MQLTRFCDAQLRQFALRRKALRDEDGGSDGQRHERGEEAEGEFHLREHVGAVQSLGLAVAHWIVNVVRIVRRVQSNVEDGPVEQRAREADCTSGSALTGRAAAAVAPLLPSSMRATSTPKQLFPAAAAPAES